MSLTHMMLLYLLTELHVKYNNIQVNENMSRISEISDD
jgi:hypothetical protein